MKQITLKKLNDELYWDKYTWVNYDDIKKTNKKLMGTIEINKYEYKVLAYFRNKYYGYDVYVVDEENRNTYNISEFHTLKTKKEILTILLNFFNVEEE